MILRRLSTDRHRSPQRAQDRRRGGGIAGQLKGSQDRKRRDSCIIQYVQIYAAFMQGHRADNAGKIREKGTNTDE